MVTVRVALDLTRVIGDADPMIYGQYLEHLAPEERCIYGAVLDEGSPFADTWGFRRDAIEAVRELGVPVVRWPGGCFADIYHWEDGIGPVAQRPVRRNWHWGGLETNQFGTDEFLRWCRMVGTAPYINFNLGTGTLDEAVRWLDYCNGHAPTSDVQARQRHGQMEPYGVKLWGIGNEQWGYWEAGHMLAREYASKLHNWAQFVRKVDPQVTLLGIGSQAANDPEWDLMILESAGNYIDFLTVHMYGHTFKEATSEDEYYAVATYPVFFEERLRQMKAVIDVAMARLNRVTPLRIAVDEWNIRHMLRSADDHRFVLDRSSPRTLRDALFAAGVFHAMLRLAPHVGMGCYVFLFNGNGVIRVEAEGIVKTALFHVFHMYRQHMLKTVLDARVTSEEFLTGVRQGGLEQTAIRSVPYVDVVATCDTGRTMLALAIINRHLDQTADVLVEPERFACYGRATVWELFDDDVLAANDIEQPRRIHPQERATDWSGSITVKPHSVTLVQVPIGPGA